MQVTFEFNGQRYNDPDTMPVDVRRAYENLMEFLGEEHHLPEHEFIPTSQQTHPPATILGAIHCLETGRGPNNLLLEAQGLLERFHQQFGAPEDEDIADLFRFLNQPPTVGKNTVIIEAPPRALEMQNQHNNGPVQPRELQISGQNARHRLAPRSVISLLAVLLILGLGYATWLLFLDGY